MFNVTASHSNQLLREVEEEEEAAGGKEGGDEELEKETANEEEPEGENPLEKYMKMVLEAREKQHAQVRCTCLSELVVKHKQETCSKLFSFFLRALEEMRQDVRAQRPRVSPRIKKTGKLKPLTWLDIK